jgi:hypothetical protein
MIKEDKLVSQQGGYVLMMEAVISSETSAHICQPLSFEDDYNLAEQTFGYPTFQQQTLY